MRWHCLHPELPDKAVLRIRTAPNSSAAVCGRVAKGKAIAAVAPEFEIADDDDALAVAADGSAHAAQQWLHVAFLDEHTGEPTEGYVMASMPNGLRLLVPWEDADCINCCRVANAHAQLFADPSPAAPVVGHVGDGEGVRYPYAVFGVENSRARILHDVHDDVWMDIAALEPMCVRLRHRNCFATHAFYMLNDELPPEAQIAIRAFPSKDADAVALLSRGEAIEVVARSGSWLQVAPTRYENSASDEAWIMWETDAWTLLVEALDHRSDKCGASLSQAQNADDLEATQPSDDVVSTEETSHDDPNAMAAADADPAQQQRDDAPASADDPIEAPEYRKRSDLEEDARGLCHDTGVSSLEQRDDITDAAPAVESGAWDDRPLNVRRNRVASEASTAADAPDLVESIESELDVQQSAGASWDDRPIRTSRQPQHEERSADDGALTREAIHDEPTSPVAVIPDAAMADDTVADAEDDSQDATESSDTPMHSSHNDGDTNEPAPASWDETPVGGGDRGPSAWDETPVGGSGRGSSAWDEMPVGGASKQVWDEYPPGYQPEIDAESSKINETDLAHDNAQDDITENDDEVEVPVETMAVDADEGVSSTEDMEVEIELEEQSAVPPTASASWDEVPVGGSGRGSSAWDEMPVGGASKQVWDEYPPGYQPEIDAESDKIDNVVCEPSSAPAVEDCDDDDDDNKDGESDDEVYAEAMTVDAVDATWDAATEPSADAQGADEAAEPSPATTTTSAPWDEVPVDSSRAPSAWDEMPVGGGSKRVGDEYPPDAVQAESELEIDGDDERKSTHDIPEQPSSPDVDDDNDEEMLEEAVTEDGAELDKGASDDVFVEAETEVPSPPATTAKATPWDDVPIGSSRAPSAWDEMPVGGGSKRVWSECPPDVAVAADTKASVQPASSLALDVEMDDESHAVSSVSSAFASHGTITELVADDRDSKGMMTLADLDDEDEPASAAAESPLHAVAVESPAIASREDQFSEEGDVSDRQDDEIEAAPDLREDEEHGQAAIEPSAIDGAVAADDVDGDDMVIDASDDDLHSHRAAPVWNESPIKQTARFFQDTTVGASSDHSGDDDDENDDVRAFQDTGVPMNDHMQNTSSVSQRFSSNSKSNESSHDTPRTSSASAAKRTSAIRDVRSLKASRVAANGSAARRTRKPEFAHSDAGHGGLSFLMEFGIRAYCRHKQILITSTEDASQSLFQAVVYSDDPECILETLTATEPPCEDWLLYSPSKVRVVASDPAHAFLDVLYAREGPSTPKPVTSVEGFGLRTPPHSSGARKEKIDRMFNRTPVKPRSTPTYDLIMNNADVDKILEAEFGSEACEMTILGPYKYPTLSASRLVPAPTRGSSGDFGAASSNLMRFSSAFQQSSLASESESKTATHPLLHDDGAVPPRALTPPLAASVANPLKRAASAIAKTPPVPVAKTASAPSLPSAAAMEAKRAASGLPPASRFGARPSSASSMRVTSSLRRPSPPPLGSAASSTGQSASTVARPRSSLTSEPSGASPRTSLTGALPKPAQASSSSSLLQRKSFLPSARPGSSIPIGTRRETLAGPSPHASGTSGSSSGSLLARRTSFGFARPKSATAPKQS